MYACGLGADGQLGSGHYNCIDTPTKVTGDIEGERIVSLSSAADCVLAINGISMFIQLPVYQSLNAVSPH